MLASVLGTLKRYGREQFEGEEFFVSKVMRKPLKDYRYGSARGRRMEPQLSRAES